MLVRFYFTHVDLKSRAERIWKFYIGKKLYYTERDFKKHRFKSHTHIRKSMTLSSVWKIILQSWCAKPSHVTSHRSVALIDGNWEDDFLSAQCFLLFGTTWLSWVHYRIVNIVRTGIIGHHQFHKKRKQAVTPIQVSSTARNVQHKNLCRRSWRSQM